MLSPDPHPWSRVHRVTTTLSLTGTVSQPFCSVNNTVASRVADLAHQIKPDPNWTNLKKNWIRFEKTEEKKPPTDMNPLENPEPGNCHAEENKTRIWISFRCKKK